MNFGLNPYCGVAPGPAELWSRWNLDPVLITALAGAAIFYAARRTRSAKADGARSACYAAGLAMLVIAFISPLCALSSALFSARAAHHVLVMGVAAPLLAAAWRPRGAGLPLLPAALLQILVLSVWHVPSAYAFALSGPSAYWLMELSLAAAAWFFWSAALQPRANPAAVIMAMALMMTQMGLLGAVLIGAADPLYAPHLTTTAAWGLSPIEDQQAAGVIMWTLGALPYLAAALICAGRQLPAAHGPVSGPAAPAVPARAPR